MTARLSPLERVKLFLMLRRTFVDAGNMFIDRQKDSLRRKMQICYRFFSGDGADAFLPQLTTKAHLKVRRGGC
jgi:hypothetical protein